ncbi:hypothetical protein [Mesorhizobium sp.]|uniref:hypothetical protein n=1 Tax=Mesorhizobium sp. TaxID=1871066 RepID=UPI0011FA39D5|nr:hypothetical protein [Mesorhizobium sp.]TIN80709.1 MAG: hypothetical protein E5Y09_02480 [Mesorhizobium sp.]
MLKITNTQKGPRGVNSVAGPVLIDPDQTVEVEVYAREKEHLEGTGWFNIKGSYKTDPDKPVTARNEDGDSKEMAEMRKQFDASFKDVTDRLKASEKQNADLEKQIADTAKLEKAAADKDAEIEELKKQLAAKGK